MKSLCLITQMKVIEQCFVAVLFIMLYRLVLTIDSEIHATMRPLRST